MTFSWTRHRFAGGALALDVANSVILRFDPARSVDRFAESAQLDAFPKAAGKFSAERALFGTPAPVPKPNQASFVAMREAIDRYFRACVNNADNPLVLASLLEATAIMLRIGTKSPTEN